MSKVLILNAAQPYEFAPGKLNATFAERAKSLLEAQGHEVRLTTVAEGYDADAEIASHLWADTIILQFPVHWMGVPWSFKKYMDEVYTAAMDGRLANGDGRTEANPKSNYGMGGTLQGKTYLLSVTLNAPKEAFDTPAEPFLQGDGIDDLLKPQHLVFKFFGLTALPTFMANDVMKAPEVEADLQRFDAHLDAAFQHADSVAA